MLFVVVFVSFLVSQGFCNQGVGGPLTQPPKYPVIDPKLFPEGGLIIYVPGTGCQLKKYGDGMQQFVWWANRGVFNNILATTGRGGSSVKFHYYNADHEIIRKTQLFSKTPQHTPEEALEWIRTRLIDDIFTPSVRNQTEPVVANWGGHQYEFHDGSYPYFLAQYVAANSVNEKGERGYLVTITSPEEQAFINSFMEEQHEKTVEAEREKARALIARKEAGEDIPEKKIKNPDGVNPSESRIWLGARDVRFEGFWEWEGGEYEGDVFYTLPEIGDVEEDELDEEDEEAYADDEDEEKVPGYTNWLYVPRVQKHKNCAVVKDTWQVRGCNTHHAFIIEYGDKAPVIPPTNQQKEEL